MTKIKEIESFDWPSMKRDITKHSFQPAQRPWLVERNWLALAIVCGLLLGFGLLTERHVLDPMLPQPKAADDAEICAELGRYSNGDEFTSYCAGL